MKYNNFKIKALWIIKTLCYKMILYKNKMMNKFFKNNLKKLIWFSLLKKIKKNRHNKLMIKVYRYVINNNIKYK